MKPSTDSKKGPYIPKFYGKVCDELPKEYSEYDNIKLDWGKPNKYEVIRRLGRGRYSEVLEGVDISTNIRCVVKVLKPVKKNKIKREVKILQLLSSGPNIIKLYDVVKDPVTRAPSLIFEYVNNTEYHLLFPTFTDFDVRYYIHEILRALHYCHSHGIMHRDIKPHNVMIDHEKRKVRVIDWGLAEYYHVGVEYNIRVASRYYKGPELLIEDKFYDYSLDIWSLGCTFAEMIFQTIPFFKGLNNNDQLVAIAKVLGTSNLKKCLEKYNIGLSSEYDSLLGTHKRVKWDKFINEANKKLATDEAINLLDKMLKYDKAERITAKEALDHPYFEPVRKYFESNPH